MPQENADEKLRSFAIHQQLQRKINCITEIEQKLQQMSRNQPRYVEYETRTNLSK